MDIKNWEKLDAEYWKGERREEIPNQRCPECGNVGMVYVRLERSPLPMAEWHECPNCSYEFPFGAESFSADGEDEEKRFFQFKEDGEIEYLVFGKGRAAKRKTHLMRFSKLHGDEPFSMYDKYRGTPNGGAVCGVTNRAGIHTFQWDETLTPDAVNCIRCSKYVQYLRDNNLLFTEEKTAESFESEYYGADNQIRDYRNIGIGAALVAGLVYWFKR